MLINTIDTFISKKTFYGLLIFASSSLSQHAYAGETLDKVKERGFINCGVSTGITGFSKANSKGQWEGLDVEYCQALSSAIFGDKTYVNYIPLTPTERFAAIQSGEVDVLARNTTWSLSHDTAYNIHFVGINYYDGQGILVKQNLNIQSPEQLHKKRICVTANTTSQLNLRDYFNKHSLTYKEIVYDTSIKAIKGLDANRCDAFTSDASGLYGLRLQLQDPNSAVVLNTLISKEPLGPAVKMGDQQWYNIAKWTLFLMINAEEYGVSSKNVDAMRSSVEPVIQRLLDLDGDFAEKLGLDKGWSLQVLRKVGNYGESFERTLGFNSPLKINRGYNHLWLNEGLLYAPPMR
ncbi:amino acid ABC transporter substrate-binding protein [Vibrio sp.]|nr:amino acid ABC transporter substrate-binding protein [Vibrio sp.]